jgi:O-antigen/teichoic acid export membrane protein
MSEKSTHILKHAGIYFVARGLPGLIAFVAIPVFTRLLDPAGYGRYALVSATVALLNALFFQWLRLALVRYLPAYKDNPAALKSTLLTLEVRLIAAAGVIGAALYFFPGASAWRPVVLPCVFVLAAQATFELFLEYARAQIRPWRYMALLLSRSVISTSLGAVLIVLGMGWWGPIVGLGVGLLLPGLWAWFTDWRDARMSVDGDTFRKLCAYGLPLSVTVALTVVISTCDRFLIAAFLGEGAAGLYSVAVDFTTQTLTLLMMVINLAMFPLAVRAWEHKGPEAARQQMRHNATLLVAVGVPAAVGLAVLSPGISDAFLGKSFRGAASGIMPLVALGSLLAGLKAYHFDAAFQFVHRTIHQVWIVLVAAVINVLLNLLVIRRFGINGSAAASVGAYLISIVLTVVVGRRHFALPFPALPFVQVLLASAAMAALLYPMRPWHGAVALAAEVAAGAAVYGGALLAMNFVGVRGKLIDRCSGGGGRATRAAGAPDAPASQAAVPAVAEAA